MKEAKNIKKISFQILILATFFLILFLLYYATYYKEKQNDIVLKTQYTFCVRIDHKGNVIDNIAENETVSNNKNVEKNVDLLEIGIDKVANIWVTEFTNQFKQSYISRSMALRKLKVLNIQILNEEENIVLIAFSFEPASDVTEYFSSWSGKMAEGALVCEWVVDFEVEDLYNGTAKICTKSIQLPEDYGLSTLKETKSQSEKQAIIANGQIASKSNLYKYEIKNEKLLVTYDGGEKWITVPVDFNNLFSGKINKTELDVGSYFIGLDKTAFLYGGNLVSGKLLPLTLIFSNDKGANWISSITSDINNISYKYVCFLNEKDGFIVIAYDKTERQESSMIYRTDNGGESWMKVASGPLNSIIRSANFIDEKIGYISYEYVDGMESNLYVTTDGGVNYAPVVLPDQLFENVNTKSAWKSVYKDLQLPLINEKGLLTLIVTQGNFGEYNSGDTVAKYQSTNNGITWKYMGEE